MPGVCVPRRVVTWSRHRGAPHANMQFACIRTADVQKLSCTRKLKSRRRELELCGEALLTLTKAEFLKAYIALVSRRTRIWMGVNVRRDFQGEARHEYSPHRSSCRRDAGRAVRQSPRSP